MPAALRLFCVIFLLLSLLIAVGSMAIMRITMRYKWHEANMCHWVCLQQ
jgi:hypothetical protein